MPDSLDKKQMKLRYAGTCCVGGTALAARTEAIYVRSTKTVRCLDCSPAATVPKPPTAPEPIDAGTLGGSADAAMLRRP